MSVTDVFTNSAKFARKNWINSALSMPAIFAARVSAAFMNDEDIRDALTRKGVASGFAWNGGKDFVFHHMLRMSPEQQSILLADRDVLGWMTNNRDYSTGPVMQMIESMSPEQQARIFKTETSVGGLLAFAQEEKVKKILADMPKGLRDDVLQTPNVRALLDYHCPGFLDSLERSVDQPAPVMRSPM